MLAMTQDPLRPHIKKVNSRVLDLLKALPLGGALGGRKDSGPGRGRAKAAALGKIGQKRPRYSDASDSVSLYPSLPVLTHNTLCFLLLLRIPSLFPSPQENGIDVWICEGGRDPPSLPHI